MSREVSDRRILLAPLHEPLRKRKSAGHRLSFEFAGRCFFVTVQVVPDRY
jgi:hypothetical protein